MRQAAPRSRTAFRRAALIAVPSILLLGMLSGLLSGSGYDNGWFAQLAKPWFLPPGWVFPVAWTILYVMQGLAVALVWAAGDAAGRGRAMGLFLVQLALNLAWSPVFFAAHRVHAALWLIGLLLAAALTTAILFGRIRRTAGLLMLPYLGWLLFAATLTYRIDVMNPGAETLAPAAANPQIRP